MDDAVAGLLFPGVQLHLLQGILGRIRIQQFWAYPGRFWVNMCAQSLSCVQIFVTPPMAHQAPWFMGCSRQDEWSGSPLPSPGVLPDPGIEHESLSSPALAVDFPPLHYLGSPLGQYTPCYLMPDLSREWEIKFTSSFWPCLLLDILSCLFINSRITEFPWTSQALCWVLGTLRKRWHFFLNSGSSLSWMGGGEGVRHVSKIQPNVISGYNRHTKNPGERKRGIYTYIHIWYLMALLAKRFLELSATLPNKSFCVS